MKVSLIVIIKQVSTWLSLSNMLQLILSYRRKNVIRLEVVVYVSNKDLSDLTRSWSGCQSCWDSSWVSTVNTCYVSSVATRHCHGCQSSKRSTLFLCLVPYLVGSGGGDFDLFLMFPLAGIYLLWALYCSPRSWHSHTSCSCLNMKCWVFRAYLHDINFMLIIGIFFWCIQISTVGPFFWCIQISTVGPYDPTYPHDWTENSSTEQFSVMIMVYTENSSTGVYRKLKYRMIMVYTENSSTGRYGTGVPLITYSRPSLHQKVWRCFFHKNITIFLGPGRPWVPTGHRTTPGVF
jgi:hypothetical protein